MRKISGFDRIGFGMLIRTSADIGSLGFGSGLANQVRPNPTGKRTSESNLNNKHSYSTLAELENDSNPTHVI